MDAALGYFTVTDFINPALQCSGPYYTRSFAIGTCIAATTQSSMYTYDGIHVTNTEFNTPTCVGTVVNQTIYNLNQCIFTPSTSASNPLGLYQQNAYNTVLQPNTVAGVDSLGFSNTNTCLAGGYMQMVNWFPLNQCMWFEYYGTYVKFTGCTDISTATDSFNGVVGEITRQTYTNAGCTGTPTTDVFSSSCTTVDASDPILAQTYLTQCSNTCVNTDTTVIGSSSNCNSNQIHAILGLTGTTFVIIILWMLISIYQMCNRRPQKQGLLSSQSELPGMNKL